MTGAYAPFDPSAAVRALQDNAVLRNQRDEALGKLADLERAFVLYRARFGVNEPASWNPSSMVPAQILAAYSVETAREKTRKEVDAAAHADALRRARDDAKESAGIEFERRVKAEDALYANHQRVNAAIDGLCAIEFKPTKKGRQRRKGVQVAVDHLVDWLNNQDGVCITDEDE